MESSPHPGASQPSNPKPGAGPDRTPAPGRVVARIDPAAEAEHIRRATVAATICESYGPALLAGAVAGILNALGGARAILGTGRTVLLKPNLLTDRTPDAAVTTHPEVVRAIIREFRNAGATVTVADSPANVTKIEQVWDRTGFAALCREEGVELVNLEKAGVEQVRVGDIALPIAKPVLDADLLVNLPKVKTHVLTTLTGAMKNLYGAIPGFRKALLHKERHLPREFADVIAALYRILKPGLSMADGIVGMDGDGPSNGAPYPLGLLLASTDSAALDIALCGVMGIPVKRVPYLTALGPAVVSSPGQHLAWVGERNPAPRAARLPRTPPLHLVPSALVRAIGTLVWIRPAFEHSCRFCGRCVTACPAGALSQLEGHLPQLNASKCVSCCCCHEVCPAKAVTMRTSPLLRLLRKDIAT